MLAEQGALVDSVVASPTAYRHPRPHRFLRRMPDKVPAPYIPRRFFAIETGIALALDEKKGSGRNSAANIVLRL
jgi:hypothetical protein